MAVLFTCYLLIRDPWIQTFIGRIAADYLSGELGTKVRLGGVNLSLRKGLMLEDILIKDHRDTTLLSASLIGVKPLSFRFHDHRIEIFEIRLEYAEFQLIQHQGDTLLNLEVILNHFSSSDTIPTSAPDTASSLPWTITCNQVRLNGVRFHYQDANMPPVPEGMDYANIDIRDIRMNMEDVRIIDDTIYANIRELSAKERCGLTLKNFSGNCHVCSRFIRVDDLLIHTENSDLSLDLAFRYQSFKAFTDFLRRVNLSGNIRPSKLNFSDIAFFAPDIKDMKSTFYLEGDLNGTVNNFVARRMKVRTGAKTYFDGDVMAVGLPSIYSTYTDLNIRQFSTSVMDLQGFGLPGMPDGITLPEIIRNLDAINLTGTFSGFYNDFTSRINIQTPIGKAKANLSMKKPDSLSLISYKGSLALQSLDAGKLTGDAGPLGVLSLQAVLDGKGFKFDEMDVLMQVHVDSIYFNNYNYHQLTVNGLMDKKRFSGDIGVSDPNLDLSFHGSADLRDSLPAFSFTGAIDHAQLYQLGLLKRDSVEELSVGIHADFIGRNIDDLLGNIRLDHISYKEASKSLLIDSLVIQTTLESNAGKQYQLRSDLLDADFSGEFTFSNLIPSVTQFLKQYASNFRLREDTIALMPITGQNLLFSVDLKHTDDLLAIFMPSLAIAPGSTLRGNYNEEKGLILVDGRSDFLTYNEIKFENWFLTAETNVNNIELSTGCRELIFNKKDEKDTIFVQLDSLLLLTNLRSDSLLFQITSGNESDSSVLKGYLSILEEEKLKFKLEDMHIPLADRIWRISSGNYLEIDTTGILIHDFTVDGGDQYFSLNGKWSRNERDTISLVFNKLDVSELDYFIGDPDINLDGVLSGTLKIADLYTEMSVFSDLTLAGFTFNRQLLGDATFKVAYNKHADRFDVSSDIIYTGNIGKSVPFSLEGQLFVGDGEPHFTAKAGLKNLNLHMLAPFVSSFMSKITGLASGEIQVSGTFSEPVVSGELNLMRTEFIISYLNVPYSLSDVIKIEPGRFSFNNIQILDSLGNKAYLNGAITHHYFRDLNLALKITMDDFAAFNNTYAQNSTFYGGARASGYVVISGPLDNIAIEVNASTSRPTNVSIPISLTQDVGQVDYIVFLQPEEDSIPKTLVPKSQADPTGLSLNMTLNVQQDAQVEVIFPDQLGNIKASGTGNLNMDMTPATPFALRGTYLIDKGSFLFQMRNLIRLPFAIKEGSSISWTGDPANANISLSAIYKTKVPLTGLTTEAEALSGRVPVECIIRLNGKLLNPVMSFGISMPNAQEQVKNIVYNALDTNNSAEMTQQVLYILVMNQFKPVVATSSPTVDAGAASLSIVTNQISSWLSGMSQNLDIGVNYKPASSTAGQEVDMTVSTQLFNDRLLIDGTFGMSTYQNASSSQASTIVGDINIEYLLTKNRQWRLRAFNRTNTIDVLYNNAPYTQGVGISFQKDFTSLKDLFSGSRSTGTKKR